MTVKRAILIGSAKFDPDSGIEPLRFPEKDVTALEAVLRTEDFGFDPIIKLIDEPHYTVTERLDEVMSESNFDDFIVFYFSGHGKINAQGELFLSCRNTKESRLNATGLKYKHIMELVEAHGKDRVAIILDCCYAGRAVSGLKGSVQEQVKSALDTGRGIFLLGASGATQTAQERELDGNGIFTKQIIEGLSTGAADIDNDGLISLNDLAKYVRDEFRRKKIGQDPISAGMTRNDDLFLGTNRRIVHAKAIAAIKEKIDGARTQFSKITYRAIEDYVEEIEKRTDIGNVDQEPRFQKLCAFATGASIEEVILAFRSEPRGSSARAAVVTGHAVPFDPVVRLERAETDASNRVKSSKSHKPPDTQTSIEMYGIRFRYEKAPGPLLLALFIGAVIATLVALWQMYPDKLFSTEPTPSISTGAPSRATNAVEPKAPLRSSNTDSPTKVEPPKNTMNTNRPTTPSGGNVDFADELPPRGKVVK
jgi:hypothetical protein